MKISFAEPDHPRSGAVVVGVWEEGALTASARRLDEATSGAINRALSAAARFSGKKDEFLPIIAPANLSVSRILLAGLGKLDSIDARSLHDALAGRDQGVADAKLERYIRGQFLIARQLSRSQERRHHHHQR